MTWKWSEERNQWECYLCAVEGVTSVATRNETALDCDKCIERKRARVEKAFDRVLTTMENLDYEINVLRGLVERLSE